MLVFYFVFALIPLAAICDDSNPCVRPAKLLDFEEACKTDPEVTGNTGSFLEQIQENIAAAMEQTKRLINIAKKKLGVTVNEENTDEQMKKCEYYQCIFKKMESMGSLNYPNMTLVETWVKSNVDDANKDATLVKVYSCFNAMATSIAIDQLSASLFTDDDKMIIKPSAGQSDRDAEPSEDSMKISPSCEISAKLMMCLNNDMMCSIFKYP